MAVDTRYGRRRLGEWLLKYALITAWNINQQSGCFLLIIDAKDDEAKNFYLKYGFLAMPDRPMRLFMAMATIEKLLSN